MKKTISIILIAVMLFSLMPGLTTPSYATGTEGDASEMNALSALGIDTDVAPDGYEENASNPYGKNSVTLNPVSELLVTGLPYQTIPRITTADESLKGKITTTTSAVDLTSTIYGNNHTSTTISDMLSSGASTDQGDANIEKSYTYSEAGSLNAYSQASDNYAATATAAGNFVGEIAEAGAALKGGRDAQTVMVYAGELASDGGIYLRFGDADGLFGTESKELVSTDQRIGNLASNIVEDFAALPYLMQNYLQVATGDFDGNGVDEIAVYVPQQGSTRIAIYRLKQYTGTNYKNPSDWEIAWNYYLNEKPYVSNMVSLTSGDFNKDGVDDLATTYGYYYGSDKRNGGTAVVMFGSKIGMLQNSSSFPLAYGTSAIVRAAFTYGDITGGGDSLILGGQLDSDIASGNLYSRFVAVYNYEDGSFKQNSAQNFDLFDKNSNGQYTYTIMSGRGDKFYSSPLCVSNLTTLSRGLSESAQLYFDSLLFTYGDSGLELTAALDTSTQFQGKTNNSSGTNGWRDYAEYKADSADFMGLGYDTAATMQYFIPFSLDWKTSLPFSLRWFYYILIDYLESIYGDYYYPGETYLSVFGNESTTSGSSLKFYEKWATDFSASFCLPDTDEDTSMLKYTGSHYFTYTDPEVLAVLASPPYFADLLDRDDLSGSYGESTTSYAKTSSSGDGLTVNATISLGAYVSFEQSIEVFGVEVAKVEAEASITAAFTYEFEQISTLEQEISYSASAGEDMVAFYSIPMEVYEYSAFTPDGSGGYTEQLMTINVPRTASVRVMSLTEYETIAADYTELPKISGNILTHTVGDPGTYPTSPSNYSEAISYSGDYSAVGFSSAGGASISQTITMSKDTSHSFSASLAVEGKAGAGAGGVTVGVIAGAEAGAGYVMVSTEGSSFSGEMQNMPIQAQPYKYGLSWKIFSYKYSYNDGSAVKSFPIVNYLVTDVSAPPALPTDFEQNSAHTTARQNALSWSYNKTIAGFQLYRYYEFPDGAGSYELAFVPFDNGTLGPDGLYHFEYIDQGLNPYTDYDYQIQAVRAYEPNNSILSKVLTARTKSDVGYPNMNLSGLNADGQLEIYPDSIASESTVTLTVNNLSDYPEGVNYQWQKLVDGVWTDIEGTTLSEITFANPGQADEAVYRCRTNMIYQSYYISAYSDTFSTVYSKRTSEAVDNTFVATASATGVPAVAITLQSADSAHNAPPTGNVTFTITGADYKKSYTSSLVTSTTDSRQAKAQIDPALATALPDGVYEITASYSGSRVFKSLTEGPIVLLAGDDGYQLVLENDDVAAISFTYGLDIVPNLTSFSKDGSGNTVPTLVTGAAYSVFIRLDPLDTSTVAPLKAVTGGQDLSGIQLTALLKTLPVGDYRVIAEYSAAEVALRDLTISPRQITVSVVAPFTAPQGEVIDEDGGTDRLPGLQVTAGSLANGEELVADLGLYVRAINTANNEVELNNLTEPANYSITGALYMPTLKEAPTEAEEDQFELDYAQYLIHLASCRNYNITYVPGTYTVTGAQYTVTAECTKVNGNVAGTVAIAEPADHDDVNWTTTYSGGTALYFRATPITGYEVKSWTITEGDDPSEVAAGKVNYLPYTMQDQNVHVLVEFKPVDTILKTQVSPNSSGSIFCSNSYFTSDTIVSAGAEMTFTADAVLGYHFARWEIVRGGLTTDSPDEELAFTMGNASTTLYAIFERDNYTLTLGSNLRAWYNYTYYDSALGDVTVKRYISSGDAVPGDTELTVEPSPGYAVPDSAVWYSGTDVLTTGVAGDNGSYTFTILDDSSVTVETENKKYGVNVTIDGGAGSTVSVAIAGGAATTVTGTDTFSNIAGGSSISLTASPSYGFIFDRWVVGSEEYTGATLNISALGSNTEIEAKFVANASYTATVTHGDRGSMTYTLTDGNGSVIAQDAEVTSAPITVFAGDELVLKALPDSSFMVDKWTVSGIVHETSAKTYTLDYGTLTASSTVFVEFKAQSYYTVNYGVSGESGGAIASAASDGISFVSGYSYVGGGTSVIISSAPVSGKTVDKWTIDGETVLNKYGKTFKDDVLTIDALRSTEPTVDILVYFTDIVERTVTINNSNSAVAAAYDPDRGLTTGRLYDGDAAVFTVTSDSEYRLTSVSVTGNTGGTGLNGFDSIVKQNDGTWVCTVYEAKDNLVVTAEAEKLYSVTAPIVPVGGSIMLGATEAIAGESVMLSAAAAGGYIFGGWTVAAADSSITTPVAIADKTKASTSFTMQAFDVTVEALFSFGGGGLSGGGSGGGGGELGPDDIEQSGGEARLALTAEKGSISDEANERLIELNATMDIIINGNGLRIVIPAGSLGSGDDMNLMLPDLSGVTGGANRVVVYYDADGNRVIVPWSVIGDDLVTFIARNGGRYEVIDNSKEFDDTDGHWGEDGIDFVTSHELFMGTGENQFSADDEMSRAMLVTVLHRLDGLLDSEGVDFGDVPDGQWYSDAVGWADENDIIGGYGNGEFGTNDSITREQLAVILYRFASYMGEDTDNDGNLSGFADGDDVSDYAQGAMQWATDAGILGGRPGGLLDPSGSATRAEVAAVLMRFIEKMI